MDISGFEQGSSNPTNTSSSSSKSRIDILQSVPTYAQFLRDYLQPNKPCLICPDLIAGWPAVELWTIPNTTGKATPSEGSIPKASPKISEENPSNPLHLERSPNWHYLRTHYGDELVSVAHCASRDFSDQTREERLLGDIIDLWMRGEGDGLYVKDWHLVRGVRAKAEGDVCSERERPKLFYETPEIFRDDWMNAFWEEEGLDDFRFVYMGVAGTFTPLHRDVYTSYSWSSNIAGVKVWRLFPPNVSHHLRRDPEWTASEIVYDVREVDVSVFKNFEEARKEMIVVEQPPGWTIFVPSGWYHQVENVTDAISINHNWCNINNLPSMYASLSAAVSDVEVALSDVYDLLRTRSGNPDWRREWCEIVRDVLKKDSGWDWSTFWKMILMAMGQFNDPPIIRNPIWPLTPKSLHPPLQHIKVMVRSMVDDFDETWRDEVSYDDGLSAVLNKLRSILSDTEA